MPRVKQVTAWVESRPGVLGEVAAAMGAKKVNMQAFVAMIVGGRGAIRMVVDKPAAAEKVCVQHGWQMTEDDVVQVTMPDKPGSLGVVAAKLGEAGINIDYAYVGTAKSASKVNLYLSVSDVVNALKVLR